MDQGKLTGAVIIDLQKAYDTIDDAVLLSKQSAYEVSGNGQTCFKNYP